MRLSLKKRRFSLPYRNTDTDTIKKKAKKEGLAFLIDSIITHHINYNIYSVTILMLLRKI